ncbi:serine hydrolase domain-containing protein [Reichenbachiella versicolor]|uniref:serine hydrolase domain-containing protein n=1 Tax=Reichenbachiella versicolor TaxID=1821036 RepID=UPI000D6E90C0|nr:serine hydrolase [Reichenbachiella versicolor]
MRFICTSLFLFLLITDSVFAQENYHYTQPETLNDGWQTQDFRSVAIDTTRLYAMFNQLDDQSHQLHSVLLIKNKRLILEEYFNGYDAATPHDLRSVSKNIISLLTGIALDQGLIQDINDPIFKYLKSPTPKKNLDDRKNHITIKHLITMSTGLECNDWDKKSKGQEDRVSKKDDWLQYTLDLPMVNDPGKVSNYCSMGVVLLAEILEQASGMSVDQFAKKYLFDPLAIKNMYWGHTSSKEVISSAKRLYATPRDLAKVGQLVHNGGLNNGNQIVSKGWIKESTTAITAIAGIPYGYLWWNIPYDIQGKEVWSIAATGNGGQYIMIVPELDIVAIFTGGAYNSPDDKLPFAIMKDVLIPAFMDVK